MHVVTLASQKGGTGKTTLAGHIAVQAERTGAGPVALIDADPQGSLADWWNSRKAGTPVFAQASVWRLREDLEKLRQSGIELVVIDTPPAITSTIDDVIGLSDLVVIPTRPSPHDLRSIGRTVMLAERAQKPLVFVINGASPWAAITASTAIALSQHGTVAPSIVHQRADFATSMIDGRTVGEVRRNSPSAAEIAQLWGYLDNRLNRVERPEAWTTLGDAAFALNLRDSLRAV